jgi:Sec-independent protein translocase protein TatA
MFDIGWSELIVLGAVGITMIGRKDLPGAARMAGTQVGRLVGMMQGARVRADRFAAQNELRQLQNELRSGLRELDAVRSEMAVAMSSQGVLGRTLGPTVRGGINSSNIGNATTSSNMKLGGSSMETPHLTFPTPTIATPLLQHSGALDVETNVVSRPLAPRSQAIGAVAEEEWIKNGIGFKSRAEHGAGDATGSVMLSHIIQQSLIFDQHDRVVQEQDEALQSKLQKKIEEKMENRSGDNR